MSTQRRHGGWEELPWRAWVGGTVSEAWAALGGMESARGRERPELWLRGGKEAPEWSRHEWPEIPVSYESCPGPRPTRGLTSRPRSRTNVSRPRSRREEAAKAPIAECSFLGGAAWGRGLVRGIKTTEHKAGDTEAGGGSCCG